MTVLTVVSHDVFKGVEVKYFGLVSAEDFGSGTEVVGEVYSISLPHHIIPTQVVDVNMKWYVVGWPIPCRQVQHTEDAGYPDTILEKQTNN